MTRFAIGQNGTVTNVVGGDTQPAPANGEDVFEDAAGTVNVGNLYDQKDARLDRADIVIHEILFRTINDVRVFRGQAVLTKAQYRAFVKGLMA